MFFFSLLIPRSVEMGRVNGTLRLLRFPRSGFEIDVCWSVIQDSWIGYQSGLGAESRPHSSVSSLL